MSFIIRYIIKYFAKKIHYKIVLIFFNKMIKLKMVGLRTIESHDISRCKGALKSNFIKLRKTIIFP
jgi:hypothetical protein